MPEIIAVVMAASGAGVLVSDSDSGSNGSRQIFYPAS